MTERMNGAGPDPRPQMKAIKASLDQLHGEAAARDLPLAATLIGAASEAIADEISICIVTTSGYAAHNV